MTLCIHIATVCFALLYCEILLFSLTSALSIHWCLILYIHFLRISVNSFLILHLQPWPSPVKLALLIFPKHKFCPFEYFWSFPTIINKFIRIYIFLLDWNNFFKTLAEDQAAAKFVQNVSVCANSHWSRYFSILVYIWNIYALVSWLFFNNNNSKKLSQVIRKIKICHLLRSMFSLLLKKLLFQYQ